MIFKLLRNFTWYRRRQGGRWVKWPSKGWVNYHLAKSQYWANDEPQGCGLAHEDYRINKDA